MSSIDERIVSMKFDGSQFASGVSKAQSVLDALKRALRMDGATRGLQNVSDEARRFSLANMSSGVDQVASKFTTLGTVGVAALATLASKATTAGLEIAKSLTIAPIMDGFREYETQMGAIQTILANTSHQGTNLQDVNGALGELNEYSDKTIYNFTEMARNIGTFTAAGVDLDTSTSAIKGIANLAAVSGSNSQQASTAMYQLSQALAAGKVNLMDWNSVVNAGMGGKVFQDALLQTAKVHGASVDHIIDGEKSFRDSIQEGWLTTDVLTDTLSTFTGDLSKAQLETMGYTEDQIDGILKMGKTAQDAATKVKTMSQLMETLQESVGSGWAKTWQLLFGDFEEAKELFTGVSDTLGKIIQDSSDARNNLIEGWSDLGGRTALIDTLAGAFHALMSILKPIGEAFREIFPPMTAQRLYDITVAVRDFVAGLKLGDEASENLKRTFKGVFAVLDIGWTIIKELAGVLMDLFGVVFDGSGSFLEITAAIGDFLVGVRDAIKNGEGLSKFFDGLGAILKVPIELLKAFGRAIVSAFKGLGNIDFSGFDGIFERLGERLSNVGDFLAPVGRALKGAFEGLIDFVSPMLDKLGDAFQELGPKIIESLGSMDFDGILDVLNTGIFAAIALAIRKFLKGAGKGDEGGGFFSHITDSFDALTGVLEGMQTRLKARTLIEIAAAIGILAASVAVLAMIDSGKLMGAVSAVGVMAAELVGAMALLNLLTGFAGIVKLPFIAGAMILLATSVLILSSAVKKLADLDWEGLAKGLVGTIALMGALVGAAALLSKHSGGMIRGALGLLLIAAAVRVLVKAVEDLSALSWEELAKGLIGVGTILGALALFTKINSLSGAGVVQSVGIILLAAALRIIAGVVTDFANMDTGSLVKGLAAITGVLAVLTLFIKAVQGSSGILMTAVSLVILGGAITILANAVGIFAGMDWETLGRGLVGMAGALVIVAGAMLLMPPNLLFTALGLVAVAGALVILSQVLVTLGGMTWDEIARGLTVLAGSLIILAGALIIMSGTLAGAAALIIAAGALAILVPVLVSLGLMSWEMILKGLVGLAGAFIILGIAGYTLGPVIPVLLGLGAAILLLGVGVGIAAIGLAAFSFALTALFLAIGATAGVLIGVVRGLLDLIPYAFQKVGEGIVQLAGIITNGAPAIGGAFRALLQEIINIVNEMAPQIVNTLMNLVWLMVSTLVNNVPRLVNAGMQLLMGLLNGIRNHIGQIVNVVADIIITFLNALAARMPGIVTAGTNLVISFIQGIQNNMPRITQAGADLIVTFVQSLATSVRNNMPQMRAAGLDLALAIADGMTGGLASKIGAVASKAAELGRAAWQAAKNALDSNSPSKKFIQLGEDSDRGLIIGLENLQPRVESSAKNVAKGALGAVTDTLGHLSDEVDTEMDIQPTIRPVLDLSDVRKGAKGISGAIGTHSINSRDQFNKAHAIASSASAPTQETIEKAPTVNEYKYVQNNYSPKALQPIEIYRQTKNQLSLARG